VLGLIGITILALVVLVGSVYLAPSLAAAATTTGLLTLLLFGTSLLANSVEIGRIIAKIYKVIELEIRNPNQLASDHEIEKALASVERISLSADLMRAMR
jgi:hypothetical protein